MDRVPAKVRVTASRPRDHIVTIHVSAGEAIRVGHRNQTYPAFVWCAAENGGHGWVPEEYLETIAEQEAVARRDYDASQLTVVEGDTLETLESVDAWALCRDASGSEGWVPAGILTPAEPE